MNVTLVLLPLIVVFAIAIGVVIEKADDLEDDE